MTVIEHSLLTLGLMFLSWVWGRRQGRVLGITVAVDFFIDNKFIKDEIDIKRTDINE